MSFVGNNAGAALTIWGAEGGFYLVGYPGVPYLLPPDTLLDFANSQFAYGAQIGVDPTIYMFAALGVGEIAATMATASGQAYWSGIAPAAISDSQFVNYVYSYNFGGPPQPAQFNAQLNLLQWYENLYSAANLPQPDLLARGAFIGTDAGIWAEMPGHIIGMAHPVNGHLHWV